MNESFVHLLVAFLVLTGLIFLSVSGVLSPVLDLGRLGVDLLNKPIVFSLQSSKGFAQTIVSLKGLARQNDILTEQVQVLSAELARLEKMRLENQILRESLGFLAGGDLSLIPAEPISFDPLSIEKKAVLDRGEIHGVSVGDAVVVLGRVLVGVIVQVSAHTSEMDLISSSEVRIAARTSSGGATGVVRGEHGLGLMFELVSQNEVISEGDKLVTSGLGGQFPKDLFIGEVGAIRSSESELFQSASVLPAGNLDDFQVIFVVKQ